MFEEPVYFFCNDRVYINSVKKYCKQVASFFRYRLFSCAAAKPGELTEISETFVSKSGALYKLKYICFHSSRSLFVHIKFSLSAVPPPPSQAAAPKKHRQEAVNPSKWERFSICCCYNDERREAPHTPSHSTHQFAFQGSFSFCIGSPFCAFL